MVKRMLLRLARPLDGFLLTLLVAVMVIGLFVLYSASEQDPAKVLAQAVNIGIALTAMWAVANVRPEHLLRIAVPLYILGVVLLIAVAGVGQVSHGARRWLHFGFVRLQPSELMKIALPLVLAWYFERHSARLKLRHFVLALVLLLIPVGLIAKEPDLGTALLIFASGFYVVFLAGISSRILLGALAATVAAMPLLWSHLHTYQRQRILTLINPSLDPLGTGYHTIQSTIAVGSGGIFGKGWLHASQSHLGFLPESTTDFIFAVFAEEFGLIGNIVLLALFLLITARGLVIAADARSLATRLLAGGITLTFFTYAFVNMGMVSGILPVVGVPLPLVSYGGTAMLTILLGFGILMSIETHKKLVKG
ncbi:MAG: rod shape-determining protein RodA [Betaproteobacteria bacterium]|nr:rod shape-determining protein RodA [Betaproteobacteria bacterium]